MAQQSQPKLARASFRGVSFVCTAHDLKAGRRIADHVFPQRDLGYHEDMGRQDREVSLTAYLNGDEVGDQRDRLLAAIEAPGPGELFHPWLGRLMVVVKSSTFRESRAARRLVEVSLSFVEAGLSQFPQAVRDGASGIRAALDGLTAATGAVLGQRLSLNGVPGFVKGDAGATLFDAAVALEQVRLALPGQAGLGYPVMRSIDAVADLARGPLKGGAGEIVSTLDTALRTLGRAAPDAARAYGAFEQAFQGFGLGLPSIPLTTSNRIRQKQNRDALTDSVRWLALGTSVGLAGEAQPETYPDAVRWRSRVCDWCDGEAEAASRTRTDKGFNALTALKTAFVDHLTAGMGTLAPVRQVQLTTPMPSLALAYRDYGDARRGESLARRNRDVLRSGHPGMILAGVALDLVGG